MSIPARSPGSGAIRVANGRDVPNVPAKRTSWRPVGDDELEAWIPMLTPHSTPAEPVTSGDERSPYLSESGRPPAAARLPPRAPPSVLRPPTFHPAPGPAAVQETTVPPMTASAPAALPAPLVLAPPRREPSLVDHAPRRAARVDLHRPRRTAVIWSRGALLALLSSRSLVDLRAARIIAGGMVLSALLLAAAGLYSLARWQRSPLRFAPALASVQIALPDPALATALAPDPDPEQAAAPAPALTVGAAINASATASGAAPTASSARTESEAVLRRLARHRREALVVH